MRRLFVNLGRLAGVAVPLVGAVTAGRMLTPYLPDFTAWVGTLGVWGPLAFIAIYALGAVCLLPVFLLTIASGAIFGVARGSLYVMIGATLGALGGFLVARYLIRDFVAHRIAKNPKLSAIDRAVGEDGRRLVFFLRLSPVVPFVLSNYALGVTRVRLLDFLVGTIGLTPVVISYAAMGKAAGATNAAGKSALSWPVLAVGIAATVFLAWLMTRIAQRAIAESEAQAGVPESSRV
ncbi:MAG: TVP38/TMEM64 family protein [Phycisphaerae bacterium]|nr:TVP38/TMEM64 family protein [Gemmatimonadaceae bacterium]